MSIVLQSTGGGSVTINEPTTASNFTQTLPAATGTVMVSGNQPAFSAYLNTDTSISSSTFTKIVCNVEEFDTNSNYNNSTGTFTPTVAGYYQVNATVYAFTLTTGSATRMIASIYKNGVEVKRGNYMPLYNNSEGQAVIACIIYCNGSTDYIDFYGRIDATSPKFGGGQNATWFQAVLVRNA
jgi:hypothetical protein